MNSNELIDVYLQTIKNVEDDNVQDIVNNIIGTINDFDALKVSYPDLEDMISHFLNLMNRSNINLTQLLETISLIIENDDYSPLKIPDIYDLSLLYEDGYFDNGQFYDYIDNSLIYKSALSFRLGFLINNNFKNVKPIFVDGNDANYTEAILVIGAYKELLKRDLDINIDTLTTIVCVEYELIRLTFIYFRDFKLYPENINKIKRYANYLEVYERYLMLTLDDFYNIHIYNQISSNVIKEVLKSVILLLMNWNEN